MNAPNLPRFLRDSLPVEYADTLDRRDRLAEELSRLDAHLEWTRRVARAAGVALDPDPVSAEARPRLEATG